MRAPPFCCVCFFHSFNRNPRYLVDNNLASNIRVLDKVLAVTAFMSADHRAAFEVCLFVRMSSWTH